jgi:EmrB/QacA subfamily drug resistance transporter
MSEEAAPAHTPGVSGGYSPQNFTDAERRITLIGIMIVFLLSALDQTIVSTAMPRIAAQLQGLSLYAWVTTAYLLSSTVMVPIYGKLSDLYGRKAVMLSGVAIFTLGSMLCGMAGEFGDMPILGGGMVQLIVFRAVQGLGGGALFISAFSIIADMFSPRERGKFAGIFGSVFGLASIIGPVVGGFFTQLGTLHFGDIAVQGWRWIFYINLPWSLLSLFMIAVKMPALTHRIPGKIDWIGAALIVVTFVPLLLALSWAGKDYAWGSPRIVGLLAVTVVGLIAFIAVEAKVSHPILSLRLFRNRTFSLANGSSFVVFIAFMGVTTFLPLYMQLGLGASPTASGIALLPLMVGLIASSTVNGLLVNKLGRFKLLMVIGLSIMLVGVLLLAIAPQGASLWDIAWRVLILGIGLGPSQSLYSLAVQNAVQPQEIGVATSTSQFFRQIGSTIGAAVFGTLLTNNLAGAAKKVGGGKPLTLSDLETLAVKRSAAVSAGHSVASALDRVSQAIITMAMQEVFFAGLMVLAVGFLLTLLIPPAQLRGRGPTVAETLTEDAATPPTTAAVIEPSGEPI